MRTSRLENLGQLISILYLHIARNTPVYVQELTETQAIAVEIHRINYIYRASLKTQDELTTAQEIQQTMLRSNTVYAWYPTSDTHQFSSREHEHKLAKDICADLTKDLTVAFTIGSLNIHLRAYLTTFINAFVDAESLVKDQLDSGHTFNPLKHSRSSFCRHTQHCLTSSG